MRFFKLKPHPILHLSSIIPICILAQPLL